ncbi:hypothetical protein [Calidifontibacter terrae]
MKKNLTQVLSNDTFDGCVMHSTLPILAAVPASTQGTTVSASAFSKRERISPFAGVVSAAGRTSI